MNWPFVAGSTVIRIYTRGMLNTNGKPHLTQPFSTEVPTPPTRTVSSCAHLYHPNKNRPFGYGPYDTAVPLLGLY